MNIVEEVIQGRDTEEGEDPDHHLTEDMMVALDQGGKGIGDVVQIKVIKYTNIDMMRIKRKNLNQ